MQARGLLDGLESRVSRGVIGGLFAGLVFLLANMAFATSQDMPAVAPMLDISTIFNLTEKPEVTPENISVGLVTHLTLSALFGVAFALVVPLLRGPRAVLLGALAFGIGLYLSELPDPRARVLRVVPGGSESAVRAVHPRGLRPAARAVLRVGAGARRDGARAAYPRTARSDGTLRGVSGRDRPPEDETSLEADLRRLWYASLFFGGCVLIVVLLAVIGLYH